MSRMRFSRIFVPVVVTLALQACDRPPAGAAGEKAAPAAAQALDTDARRLSYTIGMQIGTSLKRDALELDEGAFAAGVADAMAGRDPRLSEGEMQAAVETHQQAQATAAQATAEENRVKGEKFLAEYGKREGVISLPSGIRYRVLTAAEGKQPVAADTVLAHYKGTFIDGREFDSSYKRGEPASFPVSGVIQGWQEVLPLMSVGAKWEVVIPANLAYGERGAGGVIGPNETLMFEIELVDIKKAG